jgi:outer membrane receptor protein involved in Fe transport
MGRFLLFALLLVWSPGLFAQGLVIGNVLDEKKKALEGATVRLSGMQDSMYRSSTITDKNGSFSITDIPFGLYRLSFTSVGYQPVTLDSLHFRAERFDFNLNDIILNPKSSADTMSMVIIYAEKPLVQSKDGNITFNAGESALSAGSNASDLLTNVPLVSKDPDGKIMVRGKEPRILIDDKPVELNAQQLQDLLESMPGSSIEKIEVMTNPPAQYANEQGGVINITTKKGRVGMNGRATLYGGTRGEAGVNGNFSYRKQSLSVNINAGAAYNEFDGEGYSIRQNIYRDSANFFRTTNGNDNRNMRPNFRVNADYDINKTNSLNFSANYNGNNFNNTNETEYRNINRHDELYRLSEREISSIGNGRNGAANFSFTHRTKRPGEVLRFIGSYNISKNINARNFYQQFFNPDATPNGKDSTQLQENDTRSNGYSLRLNYDVPLKNRKTSFSTGGIYTVAHSDVIADASYYSKTAGSWAPLDALTNNFRFRQYIANLRGSVKQVLKENFSISGGASVEQTRIEFDLIKMGADTSNSYWSLLPFANINRNWKDKLNLTISYRRTIRRPGINELNPTIDFSDPYNIRFGNPDLLASMADNFDLVLGKNKGSFYANLGFGYNIVDDIFSQVRTLQSDGKTEITWQNISGRKEYEMSSWSGYTINKKTRVNISASYTYSTYSAFDKEERKFRDGGSFTSNLNGNYLWKDLYTVTSSFTFNRFANPQGKVRSNLSMNLGLQAKLMDKRMTLTLNVIDPFMQQENRVFTYGRNFILENYNTTQTRNLRLTVSYAINNTPKKKTPVKKQGSTPVKKPVPPKPPKQ